VTQRFGAGRITDAYFFAFSIATFISAVYEGVLQANATPVLQSEKAGGTAHFRAATRRIVFQSAGAATVTYAVVAGVLAIYAFDARANWTVSERHTCLVLMGYFAFYVIASAATSVLAASLYALEDFFVPIATMALRSLLPLGGLLALNDGVEAIEVFALLMCAGETLRAGVLSARLSRRARALAAGVARKTVSVWRTGIPHGVSMVAAVANPLIDRLVAAPLGPGSVTVLELGERIFYAPLMALSALFVLVAGVRWTEQTFGSADQLSADIRRTLLRAALLAGSIAAVLIAAVGILQLLASSRFAGAPTGSFASVTIYLLLGLPAGLIIALSARLLTATRRTLVLPLFAVLAITLNVAGDLVGAHLLGIRGIALASTAMRCGSALLYVLVCRRMLRDIAPAAA
jgi:peptidoglycan biosynthesis protein MviN/MurJ (putative lipid II flippase)